MSLSPPQAAELHELLWQLRIGAAAPEQLARLERLVCDDPQVRAFYVRYMHLCADLHWNGVEKSEKANAECGMMNDELPAKTASDGIHPSSFILHPSEVRSPEPLIPPIIIDTSSAGRYPPTAGLFAVGGPLFSYAAATVIMGAIILTFWMWKVSLEGGPDTLPAPVAGTGNMPVPPAAPEPVGRITGLADCRWADPQNAPTAVTVSLGGEYSLAAGLMEITYKTGAKVILQGPCTYEVDSAAGGFLSLGKLTARVEKSEIQNPKSEGSDPSSFILHPSALFSVRTPTAVVTDLGTEFGVEVERSGVTRSYVFRGAVRVEPLAHGGPQPGPRELILHESESASVQPGVNGVAAIRPEKVAAGTFVRRIARGPRIIDLLDIVAGGDGAGTCRDCGIDASTGLQDTVFLPRERLSDGKYHRAPYMKLVDGVFIPQPSRGPVQLDSAGHAFDGFPPQSDGQGFGSIWSRAAQVRPREYLPDPNWYWIYTAHFGSGFMPEKRGLLGMHANAGITFDLAAIRTAHGGGRRPAAAFFRAMAGKASPTLAELWVFVDGRLAWRSKPITADDGPRPVKVALQPGDRFLTLVTTEGSDGRSEDWAVFGDPVIEEAEDLSSKQPMKKETPL